MDKDRGIHDAYGVEPGKCEVPKTEKEGYGEVEEEIDRDVPYDGNTRYYWF